VPLKDEPTEMKLSDFSNDESGFVLYENFQKSTHSYFYLYSMQSLSGISQLFLRIALGIGFILPVMDRLGLLGTPGSAGVSWGDWEHFIIYAHTLMPFLNHSAANIMGIFATLCEAIFGICLILGIKIKLMALGAALLTLTFGLCMAIFLGIGAPFGYPVFVFTGAALVLSGLGHYRWSVDNLLANKSAK
jgi:uncharacterized membrane protein YphA (DoxX/SURF4 family)